MGSKKIIEKGQGSQRNSQGYPRLVENSNDQIR